MRFLGVAGVLCACVSSGPEPPSFDPCAPLVLAAAADSSDAERGSLDDAVGLWRAMLRVELTTADAADAPRLGVAFREAPLAFLGIYEPAGIAINRSVTDRQERAIVLAHEVGHAFGLSHVDDPTSVMHPGNRTVVPGPHDVEALTSLWGACP